MYCLCFFLIWPRRQPPTHPIYFFLIFGNMKTTRKKKKKKKFSPQNIRVGAWPTHPLPSFSRIFWFFNSTKPLKAKGRSIAKRQFWLSQCHGDIVWIRLSEQYPFSFLISYMKRKTTKLSRENHTLAFGTANLNRKYHAMTQQQQKMLIDMVYIYFANHIICIRGIKTNAVFKICDSRCIWSTANVFEKIRIRRYRKLIITLWIQKFNQR